MTVLNTNSKLPRILSGHVSTWPAFNGIFFAMGPHLHCKSGYVLYVVAQPREVVIAVACGDNNGTSTDEEASDDAQDDST